MRRCEIAVGPYVKKGTAGAHDRARLPLARNDPLSRRFQSLHGRTLYNFGQARTDEITDQFDKQSS